MKIIYKNNTKKYIKYLSKKHGALAIVGSNTVNLAATTINVNYKKELRKFTLRNKFTLGSIKLLKSKPQRSSGGFRQLNRINAIVGVRKMKGGKDHYLLKQEIGETVKGSDKTKGFVPVPMDTARKSENHSSPIKGPLQLQKTSAIQELSIGPYKLGLNDPYSQPQRWALVHKYMKTGGYGWDKKKQFFFEGIDGYGLYIYRSKKATKIRTLGNKRIALKATHKFSRSVKHVTPTMMAKIFERQARRYLSGDGK